jgi:STE24 endopeptidase
MNTLLRLMITALLVIAISLVGSTVVRAADDATPGPTVNRRDLPPGLVIPEAARPGPEFDVERATQAYLDLLTPEQRASSDAYFEGGYVLDVVEVVVGLAIAALFLFTGLSRRMRDLAERITRRRFLQVLLYVELWLLAGAVFNLPLSSYVGFVREHAYGLATQSYGDWLGDRLKGLLVAMILMAPLIALLYLAVTKFRDGWWKVAGLSTFVVILLFSTIAPVFISPLFNRYTPLAEGPVKSAVYALARANRVPTDNVVQFDASRQTTRISANVSGFLGTTRVSLNDNLLQKTSPAEIKAVLGHEMGHYVLNHNLRLPVYLALVMTLMFFLTHRTMDWALARFGARTGVRDRADPAGLPLAVAILSIYSLLMTPLTNSIVRQAEAEADAYGLNAAREPHGFAMAAMRLSTYRKIKPGYWEEVFFYDHPSGYDRVRRSMQWFAENQDIPSAR